MMEPKEINLNNFQTNHFDLEKKTFRIALGEVFAERTSGYLNDWYPVISM
ncbi:MAG: hypothetical protein M3Z26_14580 [Bacteroidota bacterium]|nr:hypothetical protein [Bacteroidota bacterium]